jgi:hypothetical protein
MQREFSNNQKNRAMELELNERIKDGRIELIDGEQARKKSSRLDYGTHAIGQSTCAHDSAAKILHATKKKKL